MADPPPPNLERLLLADDELVAATVAWGTIELVTEQDDGLAQWSDGRWYDPSLWMQAAGLRTVRAEPLAARLLLLGFISPEGEPWPPVLQLAQAKAGKRLKSGRIRARCGEPAGQ